MYDTRYKLLSCTSNLHETPPNGVGLAAIGKHLQPTSHSNPQEEKAEYGKMLS